MHPTLLKWLACCLLLAIFVPILNGGPFPEDARELTSGKEFTLRGVINHIVVPVADDFELGPTQSAYFFLTAYRHAAAYRDETGEEIREAGLTAFHITGDEDVAAQFKKLAGKAVEIVAVPFAAHTRYHRTPLLLEVKSVRILVE